MFHFCTIASPSYLPFAAVLLSSLKKQQQQVSLHVLVTDDVDSSKMQPGMELYPLSTLSNDPSVQIIIKKYGTENDKLRWALKPFFLKALLQKTDTVIYLDNDIYFFNDFSFLFTDLNQHSISLTPHWCSFDPFQYPENFKMSFQLGIFNAGFIGASLKGKAFLNWWASACSFAMERNMEDGFFVDQRYLDMSMIVDENVSIVRHKGCNVASWNMHQNKRIKKEKEILINGHFPIVFIHFNNATIEHIENGNDNLLSPYYETFKNEFTALGYDLSAIKTQIRDTPKNVIVTAKRKMKVRTRLKQLIYSVYQKL